MTEQVSFQFPALTDYLSEVREAINDLSLQMGFGTRDTQLITTAAWEAVVNAVTHGSPNGSNDSVRVDITGEDGIISIKITSSNINFALPDTRPIFDPLSRRGRGIPIMFAFMDDVHLTRGDGGVTLHLLKRLQSPALQP